MPEVRNPFSPKVRNPFSRKDRIILAPGIVLFIMVAVVSTIDKALAVAVTISILGVILQTKWDSRRDPRIWAVIGIVAAVQFPAIFLVHLPRLSPAIVVVPFAVVEVSALLGLVNWMERRFPRT